MLYEMALKRLKQLEIKAKDTYRKENQQEQNLKVLKLDNNSIGGNPSAAQQEVLKGNFTLTVNDKLNTSMQIEKYAQEPVAYYLHKRRDFLERLFNKNSKPTQNKDVLDYQKMLRYVAGETRDGLERQLRKRQKQERVLDSYGMQEIQVHPSVVKRSSSKTSLEST
jgi:hypothetical protein